MIVLEPQDKLNVSIIGGGVKDDEAYLIYDYEKMVMHFIEHAGMSEEEAREWVDFNICGAYMGPGNPMVVTTISGGE